ncbi:MAG: ATP-dependent DNA helicase RecG [Leucobacter sp.]
MPAYDPARGGDQFDRPLDRAVGGKTAKALEKAFEMRTVRDLLWHFPRRYSNRGDLTPLQGLPVGEHVTVLAQVIDVRERTMQRRRGKIIEARITDGKSFLSLTFFNQPWRAKLLLPGKQGIFSGKVSEYRGTTQLQHPNYQLFEEQAERAENPLDAPGAVGSDAAAIEPTAEKAQELQEAAARAWAERPIPIYPATSTMPSWNIELAVETALESLGPIEDSLPIDIRASEGVLNLDRALRSIHRPERTVDWQKARDSMRFREAFELQLALLDQKRRAGIEESTPRPARESGLLELFDSSLPFELTRGQRDVGGTISNELSEPHPMHRLLQGEVGSGKTIVALRAMVQVAESGSSDGETGDSASSDGGQSAMLAPTEVLAAQHFRSITESLGEELTGKLSPVLITSKMPVAARRKSLLAIASGSAKIAVGTHALLSDQVTFFDLGLIVVDEQHRFGVEQRETLRRKGVQPHVLTMTATPIPRTVALTAFGDLEVSTIRDLPPGRQGIETHVVPELEIPQREARVWSRAREDIAAGRQVYVVCPAISATTREAGDEEATEALADPEAAKRPMVSVEATVEELRARPDFAGVRIEPLTGAMKQDEKDAAMRAFVAGETAILVATTVIEVGVNVPNASMMIVRDADRFGISQLHQLRGRVGRGEHPGLCLLVTTAPEGSSARERIEAVAQTSDGFALADVDLELRREGDILGTAQSGGRSTLRLLRVTEHGVLIEHARDVAADLLQRDPGLDSAPLLRDLFAREREAAHLENLAKS